MRALSVLSLLVAGASAGIVLSDHSTVERMARKVGLGAYMAPNATQNSAAHAAPYGIGAEARTDRVFSPQQPLMQPGMQASSGQASSGMQARAVAPMGAGTSGAAPGAAGRNAVVTTIDATAAPSTRPGGEAGPATLLPRVVAAVQAPAPVPAKREQATRPTDEAGKARLARELQAELRRVGCFDGAVDGDWGPAAKRAMRSFTERVNAVLPVEEPDYILLTLVKGHLNRACGASCATGEVAVDGGRCVPKAVIAQSGKRQDARQQQAAVNQRPAPGGVASAPAAATSGWTSTVVAAPSSAAPALALSERSPPQAPAGLSPALPGRMAVGGPLAPSDATAVPLPAIGPAATAPLAAGEVAAAGAPASAIAPQPAPAAKAERKSRDTGNSGNSGRRTYSDGSYDRTFKNPKVVRDFFFGNGS